MNKPLTKEKEVDAHYHLKPAFLSRDVRSAIEGLKKEILPGEQTSCTPEYLGCEVIKIIDKWFPIFKESKP